MRVFRSETIRIVAMAGLAAISACGRADDHRETPAPATSAHDHASVAAAPAQSDEASEVTYTCPMHPSVRSLETGQCPICGMDLVAVTRGTANDASVTLDAERTQRIGVRTAKVERISVTTNVRTVGRVAYDETRLFDVTLKVDGWIGELDADAIGMKVTKGERLLTLYSPDLLAAQRELVTALASRHAAAQSGAPDRADYLVEASRERLALSGLDDASIDAIVRSGKPREYVDVFAPADGVIVEKMAVRGAKFENGMRLFRIADLSTVWIEADLYEQDAAAVAVGDRAEVNVSALGGRTLEGTVSFLYPWIDAATRTTRARVVVENPGLELRPDMYADVVFSKDLAAVIAIPATAVLYAGDKRFVFIAAGDGRFEPRSVLVGQRVGDRVLVPSGLRDGESIVVSGNFLIAAESRLKVALEDWK
jgi:Cu(I)/Ag(I) efflux system membrane fusion protein